MTDLDVLHSLLHENFRDMTRWDVYKVEVETGTLEWGVVHTEAFFQEHAKQLEGKDGDFRILKVRPTRRLPFCDAARPNATI